MMIINKIFILVIRLYQYSFSALYGGHCRFFPSCSEFAIEALHIMPIYRAIPIISWRILRCGPWSHSGYDPVSDYYHKAMTGSAAEDANSVNPHY